MAWSRARTCAVYTDLGADYYEQRLHARRQTRNHVKSLERTHVRVPGYDYIECHHRTPLHVTGAASRPAACKPR